MNKIIYDISSRENIIEKLTKTAKYFFGFNPKSIEKFKNAIILKIKDLDEDVSFIIETPYVDKIFRDSYYKYYSSKFSHLQRDCIRVSIFEGKIRKTDFRKNLNIEYLNIKFKGFFVIRPSIPYFFGRSIISPSVLKNKNIYVCTSKFQTSVLSVKLEVKGFPHSSQETETITCAETTLWAVMEYFSSKYAEYSPKLPSEILNVLDGISSERLLPSQGLDINKLSFAIKKFNFGSIIYSKLTYDNSSIFRFHNLLSCYVNSGIPVILSIENSNIGHALSCIGLENLQSNHIDMLATTNFIPEYQKEENIKKGIKFYDIDDCRRRFVFSDDNYPPYQLAFLEKPADYYSDRTWSNTKITHFIVPLYAKIYLEAYSVKTYLYGYFISDISPLKNNKDYYLKVFIASSRSYKDYLVKNKEFESNIKELILGMAMPKFIWVCEISNKDLALKEQANGLVIIDATEANTKDLIPMYSGYDNTQIFYDKKICVFKKLELILHPFKIYDKNLEKYN